MVVPKGVISSHMSISIGQMASEDRIAPHRNPGFEFAYMINGSCIFEYDGKAFPMDRGDAVYFNGAKLHAVEARESMEFLAILFSDK